MFTKYPSSFSGPISEVVLPEGSVDWEVEVVAVIGKTARDVPIARGWDYVAGLTAGQDLSERDPAAQRPGAAVWVGEVVSRFLPDGSRFGHASTRSTDRDDLGLGCSVNGEEMQKGRTSDMIFSIPELVSYLSGIVTLYPGDVIYTGTPPGVGMGRTPPRYLHDGDHLDSWVEGLGELHQHFVSPPTAAK